MGYFLNDNRMSGGYKVEADTVACRHCQAAVFKKRDPREAGWCSPCGGPLCPYCARRVARYGCEPFQQQIEEGLRRAALAKVLGCAS